MSAKNVIDWAKNYVDLSNKHQLKLIEPMFMKEATYYSTFFGEYRGCTAIHEMMVTFFARFPDVHWEVPEYRAIEDQGVEFEFVMTATDAASGERIKRHGLERVYYTSDGLIRHISVESKSQQDSNE
ncbi:MAG: nuclear transport factor 2 family protein [Nitrosomonas sp.]|nr:nuclear transport factor 2 family protein [Nitrosomonas sp.]